MIACEVNNGNVVLNGLGIRYVKVLITIYAPEMVNTNANSARISPQKIHKITANMNVNITKTKQL